MDERHPLKDWRFVLKWVSLGLLTALALKLLGWY